MKVNIVKGVTINFFCMVISLLYGGRINFLTVTWLIFTAFAGSAAGIIYSNSTVEKNREPDKNKAIFLYILMMIFSVLWLPLLYRAGSPPLALINMLIIGTFVFFIIYFNLKINFTASFIMMAYLIFIMCMIIINITFML